MLNNAWKGAGICIYQPAMAKKKKQITSNPSTNTACVFLKQGTARCPIGNIAFEKRHSIFPRETCVMSETHFILGLCSRVTNSIYNFFLIWHFNVVITFLFKQLIPQIQSMVWLLALQWHLGEIRSNQLSIFFPVSK